jgi:hypothetical protein
MEKYEGMFISKQKYKYVSRLMYRRLQLRMNIHRQTHCLTRNFHVCQVHLKASNTSVNRCRLVNWSIYQNKTYQTWQRCIDVWHLTILNSVMKFLWQSDTPILVPPVDTPLDWQPAINEKNFSTQSGLFHSKTPEYFYLH